MTMMTTVLVINSNLLLMKPYRGWKSGFLKIFMNFSENPDCWKMYFPCIISLLFGLKSYLCFSLQFLFNPFVPNTSFLYPLKTSENLTVFWCFQGVEEGCNGKKMGLNSSDLKWNRSELTLSWRIFRSYRNCFAEQINGMVSIWQGHLSWETYFCKNRRQISLLILSALINYFSLWKH